MPGLLRFGVSAEQDLLSSFDALISRQGYPNRSEALRDLMRDALVRSRIENQVDASNALGTLTLVYDHHSHDLADRMAALQHEHHGLVVSVLHVHLSHDDCLEVIVLRGRSSVIRSLSESLLGLRGVKHGKLFITLPSRGILDDRRRGRGTKSRHVTPHAKMN